MVRLGWQCPEGALYCRASACASSWYSWARRKPKVAASTIWQTLNDTGIDPANLVAAPGCRRTRTTQLATTGVDTNLLMRNQSGLDSGESER